MATQPATPLQFPIKKALIRRFARDTSQHTRHIVQGLFLLLNGWIGIQFYLWARYYERGGVGMNLPRPAGVEGWLPIAGLMNTKYLLVTGRVPEMHPAAMYLFIGFLLMSILLKKAFCSWLCPVGTFSEYLWRIGRRFFGRNLRLPRWFDIPLRGLKYLLLGLFVAVIGVMSAEALDGFMATPYGLLVDVKMLNFFRTMGITAAVVIALLVLLSMLVQNFWCRYLCPYGALMGLASLLSPVKIRRDAEACIVFARQFQSDRDILDGGFPGEERIGLKQVAGLTVERGERRTKDIYAACDGREQTGGNIEQRRLAAAGRTDDRDELAVAYVQRCTIDRCVGADGDAK